MALDQLLLFVAAGWLLNLTPGPDVLYIVSSSLRSGVRAGLVAGLGITAGCFFHVLAAAVGVSAVLTASATAFAVLKWVGAAYLVWSGFRLLIATPASTQPASKTTLNDPSASSLKTVFLGGFWTNVLNPKVAIFFLAFVPQFIAQDVEHKAIAFVLLGTLFNVNALPVNALWAIAASWMTKNSGVSRGLKWLDRAAGAMFVGFGLKLALSDNPTT